MPTTAKNFDEFFDESAYLREMAAGNEVAFAKIFYYYAPRIYHFVLQRCKSTHWSEEIVQETFVKVWQKRESFEHIETFRNYIYTIAANNTYDFFRKMVTDVKLRNKLWESIQENAQSTSDPLEVKEQEQVIHQAVNQLPSQQRTVFILSREEGLSHQQIATKLGISTKTVNNHMTEALRNLRKYLSKSPGVSLSLLAILARIRESGL